DRLQAREPAWRSRAAPVVRAAARVRAQAALRARARARAVVEAPAPVSAWALQAEPVQTPAVFRAVFQVRQRWASCRAPRAPLARDWVSWVRTRTRSA